jgi:hypothetical protein
MRAANERDEARRERRAAAGATLVATRGLNQLDDGSIAAEAAEERDKAVDQVDDVRIRCDEKSRRWLEKCFEDSDLAAQPEESRGFPPWCMLVAIANHLRIAKTVWVLQVIWRCATKSTYGAQDAKGPKAGEQ